MQKGILEQLCQLEQAISRTRQLANSFTTRVDHEKKRLEAVSEKLTGLQGLLNQAGDAAEEIHKDLEE